MTNAINSFLHMPAMAEADAAQGTVYELGKDGGGYQLLSLHTGGLTS